MTTITAEVRSAPELLDWGRRTTRPALRAAVEQMPGPLRTVAGYHFGWWDEHGRPGPGTAGAGKSLRPTLVLLSAEAVGGTAHAAAAAAAAVELVHNFSLIHDDLMDGDPTRHHRPTVWRVFGADRAIIAGDALLALALRTLARGAGPSAARATEWLAHCTIDLCDGQDGDLAFERRSDVTPPECLAMVAGKTAALLGCSCALGALCAGADASRTDALRSFGRELGMAFQMVDDLLGIWGDPAVTGKPVGADLTRRKKSLPVVAALASGTAAGRELAALYRRAEPLDAEQIAYAAALVEKAGGRDWARRQADARLAAAAAHLDAARCGPRARAELLALARLITRRDH